MAFTTIDNPELYFQVKTYTGNGGTLAITLDGSEDMSPNFVWIKERNLTSSHALTDTVRGNTKKIKTDDSDAEETNTNLITSFDSDGFTLGDNGNANQSSSQTYVAWCWVESATAGFDIVSYTGNSSDGTTTQDISHSLSAVPHWILVKNRADATNFAVYHKGNTSSPETEIIYLNVTNATADDNAFWGDTVPTSSVFRTRGGGNWYNTGNNIIAYCFYSVPGFSKYGSYIGNGSSNGVYVHLGFRPAMMIIKRISNTEDWWIHDYKRNPYNPVDNNLYPNGTNSTATEEAVDHYADGFKLRTSNQNWNSNDETYVYWAWADQPGITTYGSSPTAR